MRSAISTWVLGSAAVRNKITDQGGRINDEETLYPPRAAARSEVESIRRPHHAAPFATGQVSPCGQHLGVSQIPSFFCSAHKEI